MSANKLLLNVASNNDVLCERKCEICVQPILASHDYIGCTGCYGWYHIRCKKIIPGQLNKIVANKEWFCSKECKTPCDFKNDEVTNTTAAIPENPTIKDLYMMMVNFNKKNEEEVEVVKKDVIKLKESCNNNTHMLQQQIHKLQQLHYQNYFILKNIPMKKDENLLSVVQQIGKIVKCTINLDCIDVYRLQAYNKKTNTPLVVVNCESNFVKKKFLDAFKKCGVVLYEQLFPGIDQEDGFKEIKAFEYLTPYFHKLLQDSREIMKPADYKFVWYKNFKVLIRKTEGSKIVAIHDFEELQEIKDKILNNVQIEITHDEN
jgi:hypothetical protein